MIPKTYEDRRRKGQYLLASQKPAAGIRRMTHCHVWTGTQSEEKQHRRQLRGTDTIKTNLLLTPFSVL
jgi:hypothetical protein